MALRNFQSFKSLKKPVPFPPFSGILAVLLFLYGLDLLGSRFVFSPGITLELPRVSKPDLQQTSGVLNLNASGTIVFNGNLFKIDQLLGEVESFLKTKKNPEALVLLVLADHWTSLGTLTDVINILKKADIQQIQVACEPASKSLDI